MALADALKRFNNALKETFHIKAYDPAPGRNRVKLLLANARNQYAKVPPSKAPNKLWKIGGNGAVEFTLRLNGHVIPLNGEKSNTLPADEFEPFLDDLTEAVNAGELDDEIKAALAAPKGGMDDGGGKSSAQVRRTGTPRGTGLGNKARPDDAEWMAKFREKVGEPDPSIKDPVPNTKGTKWVAAATQNRGKKARAI